MKITSLTIKNDDVGAQGSTGLKDSTMDGLGPVVLLAGPNGGGKTRLLSKVAAMAAVKITSDDIDRMESERRSTLESIAYQLSVLEKYKQDPNKKYDAEKLQIDINFRNQRLKQNTSQISFSNLIITSDENRKPVVINYLLREINLEDSRNFPTANQRTARQRIGSSFSTDGLGEGLKAIHALLEENIHANSSASEISEINRDQIKEDCSRLKDLFREILGTELGYSFEQGPTLFGKPIMESNLSEGQTLLLKVVISLFFQNGTADDLIILFDEPETHLHPFAVTQMIDKIRAACPNAQLWIATHSLHVLAHFEDTDIWFVKDGLVRKAGKHSLEVLHSLTGDDQGLDRLSRLLSLPAEYTALKFAAECLTPPGVADTPAGDPQTSQIQTVLSGLTRSRRPLRVLDIGMGKGRLLNELALHHEQDLRHAIDYFGLNIHASAEDTAACLSKLGSNYPDSERRYLDRVQALKATIDPGTIDIAIMCNVLHEIDPAEWLDVFGANGYLTKRMNPKGFLLIVEDELLKIGERAHAFDFLVLTRNEIVTLFRGSREPGQCVTIAHHDPRYRDRLKAHLIPAHLIAQVDQESIDQAIRELRSHAMEMVKTIKKEGDPQSAAKHYAFWVHQLANADLALGGRN